MEKTCTKDVRGHAPGYVPQFRVRSNLRGGESVDACLKNVDYWKKMYNDWLKKANQNCK